ncbi:MAG: hypothetical protein GY777_19015 [Candidatus Brocadiaceae bacterium]|nr:hypothetical protein [Candidatus Brocadiaceae bacterium]
MLFPVKLSSFLAFMKKHSVAALFLQINMSIFGVLSFTAQPAWSVARGECPPDIECRTPIIGEWFYTTHYTNLWHATEEAAIASVAS